MKKMITLMMVMLTCVCMEAQQHNNNGRQQQGGRREFNPELYMKKMNEFVAHEAGLTEAESAKFFPLLKEMLDKQHGLMRQQRELMMKGWKNQNLSESDYEQMVTKVAALDVESKKVEQTYYKRFHTVLPWKKVYAVRIALSRFQMEALNHFQPGRGNRGRESNNGVHK
ncbi:MAG: hypothetical protein IKQ62_04225 [Bacteroidaceae bacterium]|nr:hypothetical protein [Bacteroidaceae bacterium]